MAPNVFDYKILNYRLVNQLMRAILARFKREYKGLTKNAPPLKLFQYIYIIWPHKLFFPKKICLGAAVCLYLFTKVNPPYK